jgi:hypothetical protein
MDQLIPTATNETEIFLADFLVDSQEEDKITVDLETEHNDKDFNIIVSKLKLTLTPDQARQLIGALQDYLD